MSSRLKLVVSILALVAYLALPLAVQAGELTAAAIEKALDNAYTKYKDLQEGANADYIPVLARVDSDLFGLAIVTVDGEIYQAGDLETQVSIQSISKVFTMAQVIEDLGPQAIFDNMGVDATGQVFNSIVAIEQYHGQEMNPLVNPGAITATSMVAGADAEAIWKTILGTYSVYAGRELTVLEDVYESEAATNQRNQALSMLMFAYGRIADNPLQACDIYTRQCSVGVNAHDLAMMAATLANGGVNPVTDKKAVSKENVPAILAVMATAGLYDDSGKWLYQTGLPAKSGVGGGIIAVVPGQYGIAVISPPLDAAGNSIRAQRAITDITNELGTNPYLVEPK